MNVSRIFPIEDPTVPLLLFKHIIYDLSLIIYISVVIHIRLFDLQIKIHKISLSLYTSRLLSKFPLLDVECVSDIEVCYNNMSSPIPTFKNTSC